jgi:putative ABC transport system permease protein
MLSLDAKMAWRNIWRNPRRSILTISAIAFASLLLVFMLSWQFGSYETMIDAVVKVHTGHLQVQARDYNEDREMRQVVPNPESILAGLGKIPNVAAFTSRGQAFALTASADRTYGALVTGIDPARESSVSRIRDFVREGKYLDSSDPNTALVGSLLARNLKVGLGDELTLLGQGRDGSAAATVVTVRGIFRSGQNEFDRNTLYMPLATFQETFTMGVAVHEIVILADALDHIPGIRKTLQEEIAGSGQSKVLTILDWSELMPGVLQSIKIDLVSGFIMYLILIVVVAFSILNTFLMVLFERTREFGVLLAVGATPGRLSRLLLIESTSMTLVGIVFGIILGSLVTAYFEAHGIVISGTGEVLQQFGLPERMYPQLSLLSILIGAGIVLVITLLTALYPAHKVRHLEPVEAMAKGK